MGHRSSDLSHWAYSDLTVSPLRLKLHTGFQMPSPYSSWPKQVHWVTVSPELRTGAELTSDTGSRGIGPGYQRQLTLVLKDRDKYNIKKAVYMSNNKAELGEGQEGETGRGHGMWSEGKEQCKQRCHGKIYHFVV